MTIAPAFILASQSASRQAMLTAAGVPFIARPANIDEASVTAALLSEGQSVRAIADALAEMKALKLSSMMPGTLVVGSDSVIAVDGVLAHKPADRADAARQLAVFSGRTMQLISAVVVAEDGRATWRHVATATLVVRPLSAAFIDRYLDAEWPAIAGCVGCFRIEGRGIQLFDRVAGDHFTILGMPLLPLLGHLRDRRVIAA